MIHGVAATVTTTDAAAYVGLGNDERIWYFWLYSDEMRWDGMGSGETGWDGMMDGL